MVLCWDVREALAAEGRVMPSLRGGLLQGGDMPVCKAAEQGLR